MSNRMHRLWKELRRRHVVSTVAAYAAAAFVLLQLGEILFPAFGIDEAGGMRALLALLLGGFPVVLAVSWVYDVTREGFRRTAPEDGELSEVPPPSSTVVGLVLVTALVLGVTGWYAVQAVEAPAAAATPPRSASIAVLPFTDMSETQDQAYLGDGIAEEILNLLAAAPELQVAARTSSFAFRDEPGDVRRIGDELGVGTVLEGSVRRDGSRVRVTAQLIDTESGFHLWSEAYDREVENLFAVQDEIAGAIAEELLGTLDLPGARGERRAADPEAQDAYWRGRAEWNRRGSAGIPAAIRLFQEALTLDPDYAQAYAGLADSWALLPQFVPGADADQAWARAEELARRAVELDPTLAEAHASLGLTLALQGDRQGALAALGRALELNPSYAPARHWRGNVLAERGELARAVEDLERAATLDPLSAPIAVDHANLLLWSGDLDGAREEFERALSLDFGYARAHLGSALVAMEEGEEVSLHMSLAQWAALSGIPSPAAAALAQDMLAYHRGGVAGSVPGAVEQLAEQGRVSSGTVALLQALVGAGDASVRWLRRALEDRSWVDLYPRVNAAFAPFRDDPGFREVLTAMEPA